MYSFQNLVIQWNFLFSHFQGSSGYKWAQGPRDPTESEPELCLSVSYGGTGQQWTAAGAGAGALGAVDLGTA